ncbi:MAG: hypothetical protein OXP69_16325 [Spirochaetaceae bacterium]|nr:hypothetical protein [Spirochaetaceae bacterium]
MVTIAFDSVVDGDSLQFRISASPVPRAELTVRVTIAARDCELAQSPEPVTIAAGESHATLTVPTRGVAVGAQGCTVTATIAAGEGYEVGTATRASATATLAMRPVVTVTPDTAFVTEGRPVSFTLTAAPPPTTDLAVNVSLSESGSFLAASGARTVTIRAAVPTAALSAATVDDESDEPTASVTATVESGSGYTVGADDAATVAVSDNDPTRPAPGGPPPTGPPPTSPPGPPGPPLRKPKSVPEAAITAGAASVTEGQQVSFSVTLFPVPGSARTVNLQWEDPGGFLAGTPSSTVTVTSQAPVAFGAPTVDDAASEADASVKVTVGDGDGYIGRASASIVVKDNDSRGVTIAVTGSRSDPHGDGSSIYHTVSEGATISFTLTATPAPSSALPVRLSWTHGGDLGPSDPPTTVTIPTTGSVSASVTAGVDDKVNWTDTTIGIHIQVGDRNHRAYPFRAYITIEDDDD